MLEMKLRPANDRGIASRRLPTSQTGRTLSMVDHGSAAILFVASHHRDRTLYCYPVRAKASADGVHWAVEQRLWPRE